MNTDTLTRPDLYQAIAAVSVGANPDDYSVFGLYALGCAMEIDATAAEITALVELVQHVDAPKRSRADVLINTVDDDETWCHAAAVLERLGLYESGELAKLRHANTDDAPTDGTTDDTEDRTEDGATDDAPRPGGEILELDDLDDGDRPDETA
jgi:hypothetical protein